MSPGERLPRKLRLRALPRFELPVQVVEVAEAPAEAGELEAHTDLDKGHGRLEERHTSVLREIGWLQGDRPSRASCACPPPPALVH